MKGTPKGKSFNDRELAATVRTLALNRVYEVLLRGPKDKLYRPVLERLVPNLLPRLNVLSGDADKPLQISIAQSIADKYGIAPTMQAPMMPSTGSTMPQDARNTVPLTLPTVYAITHGTSHDSE